MILGIVITLQRLRLNWGGLNQVHLNGPIARAVIHPHFSFNGDGAKDDQAGGPRVKKFSTVAAV